MDKELYEMIFKRKSFHLFRNIGKEHLTKNELKDIEKEFSKLKPLVEDIKVKIKIVKKELFTEEDYQKENNLTAIYHI